MKLCPAKMGWKEGGTMIKIALCDDEAKILDEVSSYINNHYSVDYICNKYHIFDNGT